MIRREGKGYTFRCHPSLWSLPSCSPWSKDRDEESHNHPKGLELECTLRYLVTQLFMFLVHLKDGAHKLSDTRPLGGLFLAALVLP
jgi:hypothetical protein